MVGTDETTELWRPPHINFDLEASLVYFYLSIRRSAKKTKRMGLQKPTCVVGDNCYTICVTTAEMYLPNLFTFYQV